MSEVSRFATVVIPGPGRNLLTPESLAEIESGLRSAAQDPEVRGIIITGDGDVFCGGLDVPAIKAGADPVPFYAGLVSVLKLLPTLPKPVVAAVNGDAVAGGAGLVAAVDYAVTVPTALIGSYEVSVGVWPIVAQVPIAKRIGARAAAENVASGEPFTAARAWEVGLVNEVVGPEDLLSRAAVWLEKAARAGTAGASRPSLYELAELPYEDALEVAFTRIAAAYGK